MARFLLVVIALCSALFLSGCYEGTMVYTQDEFKSVVSPGTYQVIEVQDGTGTVLEKGTDSAINSFRIEPDFSLSIPDERITADARFRLAATPFEGHPDVYIGWIANAEELGAGPNQTLYFLVRKKAGQFLIAVPQCDDGDNELPPEECVLKDREAIEKVMAAALAAKGTRWAVLERAN